MVINFIFDMNMLLWSILKEYFLGAFQSFDHNFLKGVWQGDANHQIGSYKDNTATIAYFRLPANCLIFSLSRLEPDGSFGSLNRHESHEVQDWNHLLEDDSNGTWTDACVWTAPHQLALTVRDITLRDPTPNAPPESVTGGAELQRNEADRSSGKQTHWLICVWGDSSSTQGKLQGMCRNQCRCLPQWHDVTHDMHPLKTPPLLCRCYSNLTDWSILWTSPNRDKCQLDIFLNQVYSQHWKSKVGFAKESESDSPAVWTQHVSQGHKLLDSVVLQTLSSMDILSVFCLCMSYVF